MANSPVPTPALHSRYDPLKEAERFVDSMSASFIPTLVAVTEPGKSFCAPFLRRRFPDAILAALRYSPDFRESDGQWDRVLYAEGKTETALSEEIYGAFGDAVLLKGLFVSWGASERAFPEVSKTAWKGIRQAVRKARDVAGTKRFFAKKWERNKKRFHALASPYVPGMGEIMRKCRGKTPVIAASGPSLGPCLETLRERGGDIFLMALSSALLPLLHRGIVPDLCISTDGGEWAKWHLHALARYPQIPLACSEESAVPGAVLTGNRIVKIDYQCGTVAGSAALFALDITAGDVYFCGLDLAPASGFQHTQPNALEIRSVFAVDRLHPPGGTPPESGALSVYRSWFATRTGDFAKRIKRLSVTPYPENLGSLRDQRIQEIFSLPAELKTKKR